VAAGDHHSMAITSFGRVFSWGRNDKGQLGLGIKGTPDLTHRGSPEVVENYFESTESGYVATSQTVYVEQVDGGSNHSVAAGSGKFWTWGGNEYGQLGEVTETEIIVSNTPRSFPVSIDPQAIGVIKNNWTHPNSESYPLDVSRNTLSAGANTTMLMYGIFYNYPSGISWGSWIDTPEKCSMSRYTNNFDVGFDHCITYRIIDFSLNLHGVNNSSGELGSSDVNLSLNQLALTEAPLDIASGYNNSGALYENKLWLWGGIFGNQIIIPWTSIGFSVITPNATEADFISISGTSDLVNGIVTVSLNGSEVITTVNSDRMWSLDLDLNSVVTGTYMASASLSGIDGKIIKTLSFELKVDHTNMTVSPTTNFLHVKPEKIFINGINSNDVESIIFSINGHDLFATINGTGWSVEPDLSNLADGDYPYEIKSEDIAGNQLTSNGIISVDGTPPHITIVSPAQGTTTLASVILVEWRVDGGPIQTRNEPLITGMNSIILVATDQAGNYNSETVTVEKAELTNLIRSVTINSRKLLQPSGEFIVSYETVFSASVTLKIMDANELVVYSKSLGFVPKGANQVTWNGLNQANQLLATGLYRFELQAEIEGQTVSFNEESTPESISASKVNVIVPYTESHKASAEFTANKDIIAAVNVKIYSPVQKSIQVLAPAIYSQGSNSLRLENYGEGDVIITERKKHNVYLSAIKAATGFLAIVRKPPFNNVKVHRRNLSATDFDFLDIALDIDRIASVNIEIRSQDGSNEKILCDGTSILEVGRHEFGWDGMLYDTVNQKDYLAKSGVYIITIHSSEPDYGDFYDRYVIKLEGGE
jgi:flagellar hook assembly protein FlgD